MRKLLTAVFLLLTILNGVPALAADWTEFGGSPMRQHATGDPMGMPIKTFWNVELGMSASQPIVVGNTSYVLAGDALWALDGTKPEGTPRKDLTIWYRDGINTGAGNYNPFDSSPDQISRSHPTYSGENTAIYLGSGKFRHPATGITGGGVWAIDPQTGNVLGGYQFNNAEVISAPLAFPNDTVVVGTTDGKVHIIRGLKSGKPVVNSVTLGGSITGSPVRVDDHSFIIGADGAGGQGKVMCFAIADGKRRDFAELWTKPVLTPHGVPASFAVEGNVVYFSDKGSSAPGSRVDVAFYALDKYSGKKIWTNPAKLRGFINNSPAVGRKYVYYTMRRNADTDTGALVAVNKQTGQLGWVADLQNVTGADKHGQPAWGNTAPLFLARPWLQMEQQDQAGQGLPTFAPVEDSNWNTVLVGDTEGQVTSWFGEPEWYVTEGALGVPRQLEDVPGDLPEDVLGDLPMGEGSPLNSEGTEPGMEGNAFLLAAQVYQDPVFWKNISGAGMELTPAVLSGRSMLLAGANTVDQSGVLLGLAMQPMYDLRLGIHREDGDTWPAPARPALAGYRLKDVMPGQEVYNQDREVILYQADQVLADLDGSVRINLLVQLNSTKPVTTDLRWFWQQRPGETGQKDDIALTPGVNTIELVVAAPAVNDIFIATVNPAASRPQGEVNIFNNYLAIPVAAAAVDLAAVIASKVSSLKPGETYNQKAIVTSTSVLPVTTELVWRVNGTVKRRITITFTDEHSDTLKLVMPKVDQAIVEVEVNPDRDRPPGEADWDNNRDSYVIAGEFGVDKPGGGGVSPVYLVE